MKEEQLLIILTWWLYNCLVKEIEIGTPPSTTQLVWKSIMKGVIHGDINQTARAVKDSASM